MGRNETSIYLEAILFETGHSRRCNPSKSGCKSKFYECSCWLKETKHTEERALWSHNHFVCWCTRMTNWHGWVRSSIDVFDFGIECISTASFICWHYYSLKCKLDFCEIYNWTLIPEQRKTHNRKCYGSCYCLFCCVIVNPRGWGITSLFLFAVSHIPTRKIVHKAVCLDIPHLKFGISFQTWIHFEPEVLKTFPIIILNTTRRVEIRM